MSTSELPALERLVHSAVYLIIAEQGPLSDRRLQQEWDTRHPSIDLNVIPVRQSLVERRLVGDSEGYAFAPDLNPPRLTIWQAIP